MNKNKSQKKKKSLFFIIEVYIETDDFYSSIASWTKRMDQNGPVISYIHGGPSSLPVCLLCVAVL